MCPTDSATVNDVERKWEEYIDNFEEPTKKEAWAQDGLWRLVGNGKISHDWCGLHAGHIGCLNEEGHNQPDLEGKRYFGSIIRHKHRSCFSYNCPICYLSWAVQQAHDITDKLEGFGAKYGVANHIVLSLPPDYFKSDDPEFKKLVKKAIKGLLNRKVLGGCIIFHGFRYADLPESIEKGVPFGWRWSPHFHILGFIRNKAEFYATIPKEFMKDGFLVNLKDKRETVFGTAWYQLNHASIMPNVEHFEVARWFGDTVTKETKELRKLSKERTQLMNEYKCSTTTDSVSPKIREIEQKIKEIKDHVQHIKESNQKKHRQKCPICNREMVKLEYFGSRTDLKPSLQEVRKGRNPALTYYGKSKIMFLMPQVDPRTQDVLWAEK